MDAFLIFSSHLKAFPEGGRWVRLGEIQKVYKWLCPKDDRNCNDEQGNINVRATTGFYSWVLINSAVFLPIIRRLAVDNEINKCIFLEALSHTNLRH